MIRTQISLERDLYEDARKEAKRQGISFAELVRRALARTVRPGTGKRPWMRLAGTVDSGPESSQSIDAIVYARERP